MDQDDHDERFEKWFRIGMWTAGAGFLASIAAIVPLLAFDTAVPFVVAMSFVILGGTIFNASFFWDIARNPRWRKNR